MFLKKVCIFLACVFLAVDIFLMSIYYQAKNNLNTLSDEMLDKTVAYYEASGISIDRNIIVNKVPDNKIYIFNDDNSSVGMEAANNLAKALFAGKTVVNMVEIPKGMSYSITDGVENFANFRIYTDSFGFEFVRSSFGSDVADVPSEPFSNSVTNIGNGEKKAVDRFLSALYGQNRPRYSVKGSYASGNGSIVCIEFLIDDKCPIEGMFANMVIEEDVLVYAKGDIILAEVTKKYSERLYDGVNALAGIDTDIVSEFVSERIVYSHRYAGNGTYYLIPVWKIEYIDVNGKKQIQYVDAIKG